MSDDSAPNAWRLPFTVADQSAIDALDPDTRATVERYVRQHPVRHRSNDEMESLQSRFRSMAREMDCVQTQVRELVRDLVKASL
jgi:hypothetical protein